MATYANPSEAVIGVVRDVLGGVENVVIRTTFETGKQMSAGKLYLYPHLLFEQYEGDYESGQSLGVNETIISVYGDLLLDKKDVDKQGLATQARNAWIFKIRRAIRAFERQKHIIEDSGYTGKIIINNIILHSSVGFSDDAENKPHLDFTLKVHWNEQETNG